MSIRKDHVCAFFCLLALNGWPSGPVRAAELNDLYRASVIVTGERDETRYPGIEQAFTMVVTKVSGDPDITSHPPFISWAAKSRSLVWSYTYHDRLFGKPIHDEQGTRDRPFDLTVQFDQKMVDAALLALGGKPWPKPRPKLAILVSVHDMMRSYPLARDGEFGTDQRASFGDASERYGLPIIFPTSASLTKAGLQESDMAQPDREKLNVLAREIGADAILSGTLEWSAGDHGWIGSWHMNGDAATDGWGIRGVNFDAAFRDAISGAAKRLAMKSR